MRISTKGRGIIRAQQGAVARPNPKENYKLPEDQRYQAQTRGMKDFAIEWYKERAKQPKYQSQVNESNLANITDQINRAEGLSLDGVANNRCITKQQFNDNLPSGGGIADAIDLLNGSLGGSTLIFFNNTTTDTTMGISIMNMYGQSTSATPDIPASSMVVYPIAGAIRNVALFGNSVIGSNIYVAFLLNNVKSMNHYSNYETDRLNIGTNQNIPVQGLLAVMCINNT